MHINICIVSHFIDQCICNVYIPSLSCFRLPAIPHPKSSQSTGLSSLCYTAAVCLLSVYTW